MAETDFLDDEARQYERPSYGGVCTVCLFIESLPAEQRSDWDALLAGPRRPKAVYQVMRNHGYSGAKTEDPVRNHRTAGHRR